MRRLLGLILAVGLMGGCDIIRDDGTATEAALKRFASEQELRDYFAQQINTRQTGMDSLSAELGEGSSGTDNAVGATPQGAPPSAVDADDGSVRGDYSQTTTQERGVDEADVVKTDGAYLYLITSRYDAVADGRFGKLQIVRADPPDQMALVAEVPLEGYGRELYLDGDRIVALTETYGNVYWLGGPEVLAISDGEASEGGGGAAVDVDPASDDAAIDLIAPGGEYSYERPRTFVTVIDATDRAAPRVLSRTAYEGSQASSRMIDGQLHLVIANFQNYYYDVMPLMGRPEFAPQDVDVDSLLPRYEMIDGDGVKTEGMVLTWEDVYRPADPDGFGVVALVSMDSDNSTQFKAVGVVAEPGLIYSSLDALYLTNTNYDFRGTARTTTDVYKFTYQPDGGAVPTAVGRVPGRVLNQYSMGEHNGYLRVATTVDRTFNFLGVATESGNNVYVLNVADGVLGVMGSIENVAPGETIQSARFIGDRGYLVTFEQIDPLFTLDLADPASPKVVGELKVPGFSTFIVPLDEGHLLTVGQYIPELNDPFFFRPWGVQLSIFDVRDFGNPTLRHLEVIGEETGSHSEALWNSKAFTYYAEGGLVALPISIYDNAYVDFDDGVRGDGSGGSTDGAAPPPADGGDATVSSDGTMGEDGGAADEAAIGIVEPYVPGGFEGIKVYRVSAESGFAEVGSLSTRFEDAGHYYASFTRGVFIGEHVYAVTDNGVHCTKVDDMGGAAIELLLREPVQYGPVEPVEPIDPDKPLEHGGATEPGRPMPDPTTGGGSDSNVSTTPSRPIGG